MNLEIVARQKKAMAAAGLDAIVSISPENVAYTSGMVVPSQPLMRWRHAICVVSADGRAAMVVVDMEETTVRGSGVAEDLRVYREFVEDPIEKLCDLLVDFKLAQAKIGIEMEYLPARDHGTLKRRLPGVTLAPADGIFNDLRMIKTREELSLLRSLSRTTDKAIGDALKNASRGMTEMDLAGLLLKGIFAGGADNFKLMIIATGERSQYPNVGPTERVLRQGDIIRMEIFGVKRGYHTGVCRTAVVDEPTGEQAKIWAKLIECKYSVMDMIKPGANAKDVYQRFLKKFAALGFEPISFVGHGIGLFLHEEPYLGRYGEKTLEEGMVLAIEPLVFIPGRFGMQNKDMIAVTNSGCELLSDHTPTDDLIRVS
ncbi:MAG: aminopeptidase P family protein [Deltaproteobacteria bacterium]|nr:aminopeptidase P family protein [Deltaproteobacteria bacterium]